MSGKGVKKMIIMGPGRTGESFRGVWVIQYNSENPLRLLSGLI